MSLRAQHGEPLIQGYVTAVYPDGTFEINAAHVEFTPKATFSRVTRKQNTHLATLPPPFLGETFDCFGRFDEKRNTLVLNHLTELAPTPSSIASGGIVEAVQLPSAPGVTVVRADGYLLQLPAPPALHFEDDITAPAPNQWIAYKGIRHPDGTVVVSEATLWRNVPEAGEAKLRDHQTFNPASVDKTDPQTGLSKALTGIDAKRLPLHLDPELQARIDAIGNSLVPAWQRELDRQDPSRIDFSFPIVDGGTARYPIALTSGIVVVPVSVIERLGNTPSPTADARIAAILAVSIAEVLEKQDYLNRDKHHAYTAATITAAALAVWPVGVLAVPAATGASAANSKLENRENEQSGRVSLWLLHDAGYDLAQAPIAWWSLASKTPKPLEKVELSAQTINLYSQLATTWHQLPATTDIPVPVIP